MATHETPGDPPTFYDVEGVARMFKMSRMTVYRAIRAGELPAVRIRGRWLVPQAAIAALVDSALAEAFEGRLEDLGTPDDVRRDAGVTLLIFRKTTQTIACWQEGRLVYVFISTLPGEVVIALARRHAARAPSPR